MSFFRQQPIEPQGPEVFNHIVTETGIVLYGRDNMNALATLDPSSLASSVQGLVEAPTEDDASKAPFDQTLESSKVIATWVKTLVSAAEIRVENFRGGAMTAAARMGIRGDTATLVDDEVINRGRALLDSLFNVQQENDRQSGEHSTFVEQRDASNRYGRTREAEFETIAVNAMRKATARGVAEAGVPKKRLFGAVKGNDDYNAIAEADSIEDPRRILTILYGAIPEAEAEKQVATYKIAQVLASNEGIRRDLATTYLGACFNLYNMAELGADNIRAAGRAIAQLGEMIADTTVVSAADVNARNQASSSNWNS